MATPEQTQQVKQLLIDVFRLRMKPEQIEDEAPLFGEGLGLDSVDAIELSTHLANSFGVMIEDDEQARAIYRSVTTLTDHLAAQDALS